MSRKRSGNASEILLPEATPNSTTPRPRTKRNILIFAIISFLTIGSILLAHTQGHEPYTAEDGARGGRYLLHPEAHVDRQATTITLGWTVTSGLRRPDGVLKHVYLINGVFPGPTIEARSGDRVVVKVKNELVDEELSLHWHGLSMRGWNDQDGAVGITSSPITAGDSFTYDFRIEDTQHGTFWYHAHSAVQRADGLFGGLVVHKPRSRGSSRSLPAEHLVIVQDWYHRTAGEALEFYTHLGGFGNEPVPDSILVNGRGAYNCSDAVPARPLDCEPIDDRDATIELDRNRENVLRVINAGAYAGIGLSIENVVLKPLAVDGGHAVVGTAASRVKFLHPGERVNVLVEPTIIGDSHLEVTLDSSTFNYPNPALTPVHHFPVLAYGKPKQRRAGIQKEEMNLQALTSSPASSNILPSQADMTFVLYSITQKLARLDNVPHGFINNTSWRPQLSPLITMDRALWDKHQFVPHIPYNESSPKWVDLVLNNLDEESHPFHLHGNDFYVLSKYSSSWNWGSYNPYEQDQPPGGSYDFESPLKKDTVLVPRRGYAVLRFRADNPGIWMLHCHVMWHLATGMAMAFEVS
ncbi:hypothetical protein LTR78_001999 [Recurvomyces mirabilis]|uniref:Laccase n=1 Tax=Recurvomyces mirabilis TaxID=574656 RepID=A0AAE0WUL5_9PEZI|nr:hypothetical protein LTR78_001999 [Recurvomyces mirabilis]KAK5160457.1 hypothetical protein LTS14_001469 [Recurvomyces mirabilis]